MPRIVKKRACYARMQEPSLAEGGYDETSQGILFALAQAVEQRDAQTSGHCARMAFISVSLGIAMGVERAWLLSLYRGGYLHDIGKVGIPDSILFKPGKLTSAEWVVMRSHAARGEEICRHLRTLDPVLPIIRHHHERWDGTGYPDGLRGGQIPLLARVVQTADIYDALTSERPYKPALTSDEALRILQEETDQGWRDPEIVKLFVRLHPSVLSKAEEYTALSNRSLQALQTYLGTEHRTEPRP
jgi:putative two-component system response regulator